MAITRCINTGFLKLRALVLPASGGLDAQITYEECTYFLQTCACTSHLQGVCDASTKAARKSLEVHECEEPVPSIGSSPTENLQ
eukprot:scaffold143_cov364-Pavlova_lutheri.AAC.11